MKKITLLLFVVFLSSIWQTEAQVTIGTDTNTGIGLPIEPFYSYSYSQVIYLQSEIGSSMEIGEIIYAMAPTSTIPNSQNWVVYMGHTTKTEFNSTSDWIDVSTLTQVFSGTVSSDSGVVDIPLDTFFNYNGTDNLIIAVDENSSGYDASSDDFYCTASSENRGILYRDDDVNPDPLSPPTASFLRTYFANISLVPPPDCRVPTDIDVAPSGTDATVTWSDSNDPPPENWEYELVNVTAGGTATGTPTGTFASSPGSLSSLVPGTDYQILMRSVCVVGSDYSTWSNPVNWHQPVTGDTCADPITAVINTDCTDAAAVKYNIDFSLAQNQGVVSCSDGNDVYGYWFSLTVTTPISLRINNNESGTNVGMIVGLDCSMTPELTCEMVGDGIDVTDIDPGTYYTLFWSTLQSGTTELCFESVPCMAPQELEEDYIGSNSAHFHWDAPASANEVEWEVTEAGQSTIIDSGTTADDNVEVVNLVDNTNYTFKVRSNCGGGVYSDWSTYDFRSLIINDTCEGAISINSFPYSISQDASNATNNEGFINNICGTTGMNDGVWYTFTVLTGGEITVTVDPMAWDVELAIYSGSCDNFTCVSKIDAQSSGGAESITFTGNSGVTYYLNIGYFSSDVDGAEGLFDLDVNSTEATLGIAQNRIDGFTMYPNPVLDILSLTAFDTIDTITVYNMLGQVVLHKLNDTTSTQIDLSILPNASYIIKVQVGNQIASYNLLKQ